MTVLGSANLPSAAVRNAVLQLLASRAPGVLTPRPTAGDGPSFGSGPGWHGTPGDSLPASVNQYPGFVARGGPSPGYNDAFPFGATPPVPPASRNQYDDMFPDRFFNDRTEADVTRRVAGLRTREIPAAAYRNWVLNLRNARGA